MRLEGVFCSRVVKIITRKGERQIMNGSTVLIPGLLLAVCFQLIQCCPLHAHIKDNQVEKAPGPESSGLNCISISDQQS